MATGSFPSAPFRVVRPEALAPEASAGDMAWRMLKACGSLKITVVMFLAATFLLFIGTLAHD